MLINEVYNDVLRLSNKAQNGGFLNATRYNEAAVFSQIQIINELAQLAGFNQRVISLCGDVLKTATVNLTNGVATLPSDYLIYHDANSLFFDNASKKFKEYPIDYVDKAERAERLRSRVVPPELDYPIATEDVTSGLLIEPTEIPRIKLTYFYLPTDPQWVGTDAVPPVFDPDASTDFVLDEKFHNILVYKIATQFSIEIRDPMLMQSTTKTLIDNYFGQQTN